MNICSIEHERCSQYLKRADGETSFVDWLRGQSKLPVLLAAEGFEERSLGVLRQFATQGCRLPAVFLGRYVNDDELNQRYRPQFEMYAEMVSPGAWRPIDNREDGKWVQEALEAARPESVALDITGLSNRGLFSALDAIAGARCKKAILYSEAAEYWPKQSDWERMSKALRGELSDSASLAEVADKEEWLYGREFSVELLPGHDGYDVAGTSALVAFLPFKAARLAAVLSRTDYSEYLFIAGRPRLDKNQWRLDALKQINAAITKQWPVEEMSTFGYRDCLEQLASLLFCENSLSYRCDVHLAPMGSKLQTVSCWALSRIARSITLVTGVPRKYYADKYSEGIGQSWGFAFIVP